MAPEPSYVQLIDADGGFNVDEFNNFCQEVRISYVVSIMGPQSSGKSTLLNHLFGTKFGVMDASEGRIHFLLRKQTTRGIWVAVSGTEPCTLVMDLEGTDGRERGENDTFEKLSALFALAMSNIVLINLWCHDIGREKAANKSLLETVFQVMLRICSPPRKVTLMFVLRDKTKTPLNALREDVLKDIQKIWDSIDSGKGLEEFFDVKVEALCNYERDGVQFEGQVAGLKKKICGVDGYQSIAVTASVFSEKAQQIWKDIKDDKNLNIPPFKVLLATYRCDEIAKEKLERFTRHAKKGSRKSFRSLRKIYLSEYEKETLYYDKVVRSEKRKELKAKMLLKETDFNRNGGERTTAALNVVGVLSAIGIAAAGLAIPGMQPLAVAMIPVIAAAVSRIAGSLSTRG